MTPTDEILSTNRICLHHVAEVERLIHTEPNKAQVHADSLLSAAKVLADQIFWMNRNSGEVKK